MNQSLPGLLDLHETNILPKDGSVAYHYPFFNEERAQFFYDYLLINTPWRQEEMIMYDKMVQLPRLIYRYDESTSWPSILQEMKKEIELFSGNTFNCVLLNLYRNQHDHVSWHSDRADHPDDLKIIASLSLGEERHFQLKHKWDKSLKVISLNLKSGSLLIMNNIQQKWLHRVALTKKEKGPRINLTFRNIRSIKH